MIDPHLGADREVSVGGIPEDADSLYPKYDPGSDGRARVQPRDSQGVGHVHNLGTATRAHHYDPGADAALRHPDWVIRHRNLHGVPEVLCLRRRVILIEDTHDRASRRCNLAHAIAHIDLAHEATSGHLSKRQELAADRLAARRLIALSDLTEAVVWSESFEEVARELDVDERMLWVRSRYLHPAERGHLYRVLDSKILTA